MGSPGSQPAAGFAALLKRWPKPAMPHSICNGEYDFPVTLTMAEAKRANFCATVSMRGHRCATDCSASGEGPVATRSKHVVCRLGDAEHDILSRAADACGATIETYLVDAGLRIADSMGMSVPYGFSGWLLGTQNLPDLWYEASSEEELIEVLKGTLRGRDLETASAMALELLDFPINWADLEVKERRLEDLGHGLRLVDRELVRLVKSSADGEHLPSSATAWACYKEILQSALRFRQPSVSGPFK